MGNDLLDENPFAVVDKPTPPEPAPPKEAGQLYIISHTMQIGYWIEEGDWSENIELAQRFTFDQRRETKLPEYGTWVRVKQ